MIQVFAPGTFRVVTKASRENLRQTFKLGHNFALENFGRKFTCRRIKNHYDFGAVRELVFNVADEQRNEGLAELFEQRKVLHRSLDVLVRSLDGIDEQRPRPANESD